MLRDHKLKTRGMEYDARLIPLWLRNIFDDVCCLFGGLLIVSGREFVTVMVGGKQCNRRVGVVLKQ